MDDLTLKKIANLLRGKSSRDLSAAKGVVLTVIYPRTNARRQSSRTWTYLVSRFLSHPVVLLVEFGLAVIIAPHAPEEFGVGIIMGMALSPIILGERRQANLVGAPRRREDD